MAENPSNQAFAPVQLTQFKLEDFQSEDGINLLNQWVTQATKALNANIGTAGPVTLPKGLDVQGAAIANVGGVGPEHSAVSHAFAEKNYSAAAISKQLEAGQPNSPKSLRRINDNAQQEKYSSFLNSVMNTAPTSNTSTISASGFTATVSAGFHQYVDGSLVSYSQRSDTLAASGTITFVSLTRTSGVVTAVTSTPHGLAPSDVVLIAGAVDSSFDGSFIVATVVNATTFKYAQAGIDASTTGGSFTTGRCYYYYLRNGSRTLSLSAPFDTDTQSNRVAANLDGSVLIAVVAVTGSGIDLTASAAGATPPAVTNGIHITNRV